MFLSCNVTWHATTLTNFRLKTRTDGEYLYCWSKASPWCNHRTAGNKCHGRCWSVSSPWSEPWIVYGVYRRVSVGRRHRSRINVKFQITARAKERGESEPCQSGRESARSRIDRIRGRVTCSYAAKIHGNHTETTWHSYYK